jgi:hypothetical protein
MKNLIGSKKEAATSSPTPTTPATPIATNQI